MADPFDILGGPDDPVAPDAAFTARLRARLERALTLPRGVTVSDLDVLHPEELDLDLERGRPSGPLVPYIAVAGAEAAIDYYRQVFGATVADGPIVMPDGRIGHAELAFPGGARMMLSEEHPEIGVTAPGAQRRQLRRPPPRGERRGRGRCPLLRGRRPGRPRPCGPALRARRHHHRPPSATAGC